MAECNRKDKWFRGCKFEPRYDVGAPDLSQFESIARMTSTYLEKFRKQTYVKDVCTTCGKVILRGETGQ